jgi:hypothetical protein
VDGPPDGRVAFGGDREVRVGGHRGVGDLAGEQARVGPHPRTAKARRQRGQRPANQPGGDRAGVLVTGQQLGRQRHPASAQHTSTGRPQRLPA